MDQPIAQLESPYEASRRIENLLRLCTVAEVRTTHPARCRVRTGQLLTDWLPWLTLRAGATAGTWWAPEPGEQCLLLSPGGDLRQGVVLPGLYSDQNHPPPGARDSFVIRLGLSLIEITAEAVHIRVGETHHAGGLTIDRDGVHASPDADAMGVSLVQHKHLGVMPGPSLTGPPVAEGAD